MMKTKFPEPYRCHKCGKVAMYMDWDKNWWCFFKYVDGKNKGICKNDKKD